MQDMDGGTRFIGWGESSYFTEYDADPATPIFDARLADGDGVLPCVQAGLAGPAGGATVDRGRSGDAPPPSTPAGTAPLKSPAGWCSEAPSQTQLGPLGSAARRGFETAITVPAPAGLPGRRSGNGQR